MKLEDLFATLSYGELSSQGFIDSATGMIAADSQSRIVTHINGALRTISKKIPYKQDYVKLAAAADTKSYTILPTHAVSNTDVGNTAPRYLIDTVDEPFMGGIVKILEVTRLDRADTPEIDETLITAINKRKTDSGFGVKIVGSTSLILEQPLDGDFYRVDYQKQADSLSVIPVMTETVDIPASLELALELSTAARVLGVIGNETAAFKSQELWARYREEMGDLMMDDTMSQTQTDGFDRLRDKGFV